MDKIIDLSIVDNTYWTLVSDDIVRNPTKGSLALCKCVCGTERLVSIADIKRGKSKACITCARWDDPVKLVTLIRKHRLTGNITDETLYKVWRSIEQRCNNPKDPSYVNYGGRGILLCDEWKDCLSFIDWGYSSSWTEGLTIERLDVNGNYCPENCEWISKALQARNKRKYSNNKTGTNGVQERSTRWACNWYDSSGKFRTKSFSKQKYGGSRAREMAIEYREQMIKALMEEGVFYGEFHGQ